MRRIATFFVLATSAALVACGDDSSSNNGPGEGGAHSGFFAGSGSAAGSGSTGSESSGAAGSGSAGSGIGGLPGFDGGFGFGDGGFNFGNPTLNCGSAADCADGGPGQVCCFTVATFTAACQAGPCAMGDYQQCAGSDSECPTGYTCMAAPMGIMAHYCAAPAGATGDGGVRPRDAGPRDTGAADTGTAADTGAADTGTSDTGATEAGAADAGGG